MEKEDYTTLFEEYFKYQHERLKPSQLNQSNSNPHSQSLPLNKETQQDKIPDLTLSNQTIPSKIVINKNYLITTINLPKTNLPTLQKVA